MKRIEKLENVYNAIINCKVGCDDDVQYDFLNDAGDAMLDVITEQKRIDLFEKEA